MLSQPRFYILLNFMNFITRNGASMKYTKGSTLKEILEEEGAEEILSRNGVPCVSCPRAKMEMDKLTIGDISDIYGLNLNLILEDLNK